MDRALRGRRSSDVAISAAELLVPKSGSHSLINPLRRSGSLRRSRTTPSSSLSLAAERELSALLRMATPDLRTAQQRGKGKAKAAFPSASSETLHPRTQSPRVTSCSFSQNQQPHVGAAAPEPCSSPPKTRFSSQNTNNATITYLSCDATRTRLNTIDRVQPTSDVNQQSDHNNNSNDPGLLSERPAQAGLRRQLANLKKDLSGQTGGEGLERSPAPTGRMSVALERCTLVPELKAFDQVLNRGLQTSRLRAHHQVIPDCEEEGGDTHRVQNEQDPPQVENAHESDVRSESQTAEEEEGQEEVSVWCVTGVCEAAGDNRREKTDKFQPAGDNQRGSQRPSSAPANHQPSELQRANEKSAPVPISSQPVPVSRYDDHSPPVSSPRRRPAEPASADRGSTVIAGASKEDDEAANQEEAVKGSTNEETEPVTEQSADDRSRNEQGKAESLTSSKSSTKNLPTSETRHTGTKPSDPNKSRPVRTLTNSENQELRRVVSISRNSKGAAGNHRGSPGTAAPSSQTGSSFNSSSLRQGERPSTAPSSQRSSINKAPDPKDSKDQKVSGTSVREQNRDLQKNPSIRKPVTKPKVQPEERMCRATLRALGQAGGGGGSISAPTTPFHKATSSSPLPSFARNTASSSFRCSQTSLAHPHSPHTGSKSSPKSPPKTSSPSPVTSSPLTRTGSVRVAKSSNPHNPSSSSPQSRSQSIRAPPHSPLHDSLAPPKGHLWNDSGTFSDKSAHSRDSGKSTRPNWR